MATSEVCPVRSDTISPFADLQNSGNVTFYLNNDNSILNEVEKNQINSERTGCKTQDKQTLSCTSNNGIVAPVKTHDKPENTGLLTYFDPDGYSNVQEIFSSDNFHWHAVADSSSSKDFSTQIKKSTHSYNNDSGSYADVRFSTFGKSTEKLSYGDEDYAHPVKPGRSHSIDASGYSQVHPVTSSRISFSDTNSYASLPRKQCGSYIYSSLPRKTTLSQSNDDPSSYSNPNRTNSYSSLTYGSLSNLMSSNTNRSILRPSSNVTGSNKTGTTWQFGQKRSSCPYGSPSSRNYRPHSRKFDSGSHTSLNDQRKSAFYPVSQEKQNTLKSIPKKVSVVSLQPSKADGISLSSGHWSVSTMDGQQSVLPVDRSEAKKSTSISSMTEGFKCGLKELTKLLYKPLECCQKKKVKQFKLFTVKFYFIIVNFSVQMLVWL